VLQLPLRTRVCLGCRSLFVAGEECDGGAGHKVVDVATKKGRRSLVHAVWGVGAEIKAKEVARAGGTGAGVGGAGQAMDCSGCSGGCDMPDVGGGGEVLAVLAVIAVAAIAAIALYFLVKVIVVFVRRKMNEPRATGAVLQLPALPAAGAGLRGKVTGTLELTAPITSEPCVAYLAELTNLRVLTRHLMLREARTSGFEVTLDDGRIVRVPAGRLHLEGERERFSRSDRPSAESWVEAIDKETFTGEPLAPIPFDEAAEARLMPGDVVELAPEVDTVADPTRATGYRDAAMVLAPVGVPRVRLIEKAAS
jgi:hypothetical protein